jgi:hypothetical protein
MPPKALPVRDSKNAPSFDGNARSVTRYFEDVAEVAAECGRTTSDEQIATALRYLSLDNEMLWKGQKSQGQSWADFKKAILKLYPGSEGDRLYTWTDLRDLVKDGAKGSIARLDDLGDYMRKFQRVSEFLKTKGKISDRETRQEFVKGLPYDFRMRVFNQCSS